MRTLAQVDPRVPADRLLVPERTLASVGTSASSGNLGIRENAPVIIMNLFYTGIAIARDLAGRGIQVVGLSAEPKIYGNFTRFCDVRSAPNSQKEPEALLELLLRAAGELHGAVIFPTRDFDVLFLDRYRSQLEPHYRLAIPPRSCLLRIMNKHDLAWAAQQAGVPVPRTLVVRSRQELSRVAEELGFPCVVKPVSSFHWRETGNWDRVGGRKAFLVTSMRDLQNEYETVRRAHPEVLVQPWIPGKTAELVILGGYVGEDSQPLAWFTARKIVQSPDDFGTGCIVRSEEIREIFEPTVRLWQALGYQGMAEVEYKRDPRTGKFLLIEMNARHWDQHRLGSASGINLSLTAYLHLTGQRVVPVRPTIKRAAWIAEDALLFYGLRGLFRRDAKLTRLWQQLGSARVYGIFSWNDPWPFVRYMVTVVLPMIAKQSLRKLRSKEGLS